VSRSLTIRLIAFYTLSVAFLFLNSWLVIKKNTLMAGVLPILLVIILLAVHSPRKLLLLVVFLTPLSLPLTTLMPGLPVDLFLPTEPILFGLLMLFLFRLASGAQIEKKILVHPVSIMVWIYLFWILVTSITSSMPLVSFKFLLVKIWFVAGVYLMGIYLFENSANYSRFVWLYTLSLMVVIGYTVSRHLGYGLTDKQAAHYVMNPFYKDHTSYGAMLAMFLPFMMVFSFNSYSKSNFRWIARLVLVILAVALVLSYTRAAWLSLVMAMGVWILIRLKIRFKTMVITAISILAVILVFQKQIVMYLERNDEESSSDLVEHFSSMSNITSDASNLERINRWSCAIRMFRERPVFGYGPGTYMFKYAPYQLKKERTIISTNAGDGGNAHSEYLGPLAESGLAGMVTVLMLIITVMYTAFMTYSRLRDPRLKGYLSGAIIGLITYYAHGLMNNFLDTDKASVPFWGFTAMIVTLDLYSRKSEQKPER
jgi:O-antigen ligase